MPAGQNEKSHGESKSKDRLAVMVCCYMTDNDKVKLLVTGPIFRQQKSLDKLDARFKAENRKVPN
jgi:hypothetical protein